MPFTETEKILRKAYLGEKDPKLDVWNILSLRCLSGPGGATYPVSTDFERYRREVWAEEAFWET